MMGSLPLILFEHVGVSGVGERGILNGLDIIVVGLGRMEGFSEDKH